MTNPSITYINKPSFPNPPSKQPYHLRKLNWMVPFAIPQGHKLLVSINGTETDDWSFYSSVLTLKQQPNDGDEITITTIEIDDDD